MPPRPIEEIDFQALADRIYELLLAVWASISAFFIALWHFLCQAFWDVWTWAPFEAFRNEFIAALIALAQYAADHPTTTAAIVILVYVVIPGALDVLRSSLSHCLGSRRRRIILLRDSYAANYQSTSCGGNVPGGSTFARCQSQAAQGESSYQYV